MTSTLTACTLLAEQAEPLRLRGAPARPRPEGPSPHPARRPGLGRSPARLARGPRSRVRSPPRDGPGGSISDGGCTSGSSTSRAWSRPCPKTAPGIPSSPRRPPRCPGGTASRSTGSRWPTTGMGGTAWHGTATGWVDWSTTRWSPSSPSAPRGASCCDPLPAARRALSTSGWGDLLVMGGSLPANLAACGAQGRHRGPAPEHPVPPGRGGRRRLSPGAVTSGDAGRQAPVNRGGRFARKASMPSRASAVRISSMTASPSSARPSSRGRPWPW